MSSSTAEIGFVIAVTVTAALVLFLVAFYGWVYRRNKKLGTPGIVMRTHLACPKCHQQFDYDFIPGASFTAVRLGTSRYMACPMCKKWAIFPMVSNQLPVGSPKEN